MRPDLRRAPPVYVTIRPPDLRSRATLQRCNRRLALTGERTLPGIPAENYWFRRHEAAYDAVVPFCPGAVVLEAGCGEGYGADRLAEVARVVLGLDYDAAAVGARRRRRTRGSAPVRGNLASAAGTGRRASTWWPPAGDRAPVGPARVPGRVRAGAPPGRHAAAHHAQPADVLAAEPAAEPVPLPRARPGRAGRAAGRGRASRSAGCSGCGTGRGCARLDRRFGSLVDAQLAGPPATWHPELRRAVTAVRTTDFVLRSRRPRLLPRPRRGGRPAVLVAERTQPRAPSAWCCTPTCRGWRTPAPGRSARSGCTRRSPAPGGGCSRCSTGWPPRAPGTCSPSASPRCWRRCSTTRTACASCTPGPATGSCARRSWPAPRLPRAGRRTSSGRPATCLADLEDRWLTGGLSAVLRPLVDAGRGRAARRPGHPPVPAAAASRGSRPARCAAGLDDARLRLGRAPAGIWAPECGHAPGLEDAVRGGRGRAVPGRLPRAARRHRRGPARSATSGVLCFGRDLEVTYRVWSPRAGYPGAPDYRDFHTFDHASGFRPARVTGRHVPPEREAAVGAGPGRGGGTPGRGRLRRHRARAGCATARRPGRAAGAGRGRATTPSCSGTGGTRGRHWLAAVLRRCRPPACG